MVVGVVEGVLLDPGQRAHPVVDASGRWVFDRGDRFLGAHPTVSARGEWVSDDRDPEVGGLDRVVVSAPGGVREPWEYRPPSESESYFGAPGDLWSGMVDWWFSHDIPTEGLPSGGGLMVGPLELAKLGNFLKDALLPLMAGDVGLAGAGGFIASDPVPVPFGKVIGEGVKGAKWVVKAVKAVGKGDDVVAGLAKSVPDTPAFYGIERLDETGWGNSEHDAVRGLFEESGESLRGNARMLSPDDPVIPDVVYHVTASGSDIAEEGVLRVGKDVGLGAGGGPPERLISFTVSREVAERLAADFELRRQIAVAATRGGRDEVGDLLKAESRRWGIATLSPKRREELTSITGFPEGRSIDYEWEYYLHTESSRYDLDEVLSFFFRGRNTAGGPRDPLFMVGAGHLKEGRPEPLLSWATKTADDIQILAVPKENLAASGGAVVDFDLGKGFLEEIRVYGDVPVPAGGVARETGETVARVVRSLDEFDQVAVEAWPGGPTFYHGSGQDLSTFTPLDAAKGTSLGGRSAMGDGLYTTPDLHFASTYADAPNRAAIKHAEVFGDPLPDPVPVFVYNVRFTGEDALPGGKPNLLDYGAAGVPDDAKQAVLETLEQMDDLLGVSGTRLWTDAELAPLLSKLDNPRAAFADIHGFAKGSVIGAPESSLRGFVEMVVRRNTARPPAMDFRGSPGVFSAAETNELVSTVMSHLRIGLRDAGYHGYVAPKGGGFHIGQMRPEAHGVAAEPLGGTVAWFTPEKDLAIAATASNITRPRPATRTRVKKYE